MGNTKEQETAEVKNVIKKNWIKEWNKQNGECTKKSKSQRKAKDGEDYWQPGLNPPLPSCRFTIGKTGLLQASVLLALQSK